MPLGSMADIQGTPETDVRYGDGEHALLLQLASKDQKCSGESMHLYVIHIQMCAGRYEDRLGSSGGSQLQRQVVRSVAPICRRPVATCPAWGTRPRIAKPTSHATILLPLVQVHSLNVNGDIGRHLRVVYS